VLDEEWSVRYEADLRYFLRRNDLSSMISRFARNLLKAAATFPNGEDRLLEDRNKRTGLM
jgi:hypothetical protein